MVPEPPASSSIGSDPTRAREARRVKLGFGVSIPEWKVPPSDIG